MKKLLALLIAVVMCFGVVALAACDPDTPNPNPNPNPTPATKAEQAANLVAKDWNGSKYLNIKDGAFSRLLSYYNTIQPITAAGSLTYADNTVLRMATGYNSKSTGIAFDAETAGSGITLADGKTYNSGDLKPTWVELENRLKIKFENKYQGNSASKEWENWKEKLDQVDLVSGTASLLNEAGAAGSVINIADYLDKMPNFAKYLNENPIVRLSITGSTEGSSKGAIYFSPYFDGVNDIERMPLMRIDWVEELLDGEEAYHGDNRAVDTSKYTPYITADYSIESLTANGQSTQTITKEFGTGAKANIISQMNAASNLTGDQAVAMLRAYIDAMYGNTYAKRSDLFVGYDAAYDADELVALLRCVVASKSYGDNNTPVAGLFSRETNNNQRRVDLFRFAGTLFGVRGLESRQDYLYVGNDGKLHDARQEASTYEALDKMNQMAAEGLILVKTNDDKSTSENILANDSGFMHYDYSQTQTVYNETKLQEGEKYSAVMVPVAIWNDGTGAKAMRFTESWRSVKTDGWALSKAGIGNNTDKLNAALKLIDYAYSKEGQILMSYGPDAFIKHDDQGNMVMFDFNGEQWPVIADATYAELWAKAGGNYTNYARKYLGSTLSFLKSQSFEYQCTHEVGREGAGKISAAIGKGTIKHPELAVTENKWYMSVPTVLPTTKEENTQINTYVELTDKGNFSQSKGADQKNLLVDFIEQGYVAYNISDEK